MNATYIIGFSIEFVVQTIFLVVALWIMIKLQKLDYSFFRLLVAAAVSILIGMVLDPLIGIYLSSFVVVGVLSFGVWKATRADRTDVCFTIAVGYALTFCMNLFVLGALMGDLRVAARESRGGIPNEAPAELVADADTASAPPTVAEPIRPAAQATNAIGLAQSARKGFSVRGVTRNATRSSVVIEAGSKQYTLFAGDMVVMTTAQGTYAVQFKELDGDEVVLNVEGEEIRLAAE